ncbi:hypothetical protein [Streptomyces hokutonensis]|nr:hypothetical protein [Streptomyces hokutonensis]
MNVFGVGGTGLVADGITLVVAALDSTQCGKWPWSEASSGPSSISAPS